MQMILDQHSSALSQPAPAIRLEIGAKLSDELVRVSRSQAFSNAVRGGNHRLIFRHVLADRIHQAVEILVGHDGALSCFCSARRVRCTVAATVMEEIPKALAISGLVRPSKNRSVKIS